MATKKAERMRARESVLGYRMSAGLAAVASVEGEVLPAGRLVQLSPEHLTVCLQKPTALRPGQRANVMLGVGREATCLRAEVVNVHVPTAPEALPELSLRFVAPPLAQGRHIVTLLEGWRDRGQLETPHASPIWKEHITRPDRIGRIFEALTARRCRGMARSEAGDVELSAALFDKYDGRVAWEVRGGVLPPRPFMLEVFGFSSVMHFPVHEAHYDDGLWSVPMPRELVRYRHRRLRRAAAWGGCVARFAHPLWPQVRVERELMDISYEGLSFATEPGEDLLYPGLVLPELEVSLPGGRPVRLKGEVRNISGTASLRRCGMKVEAREEDTADWRALVEELSHPNTRVAGAWDKGTWNLFERSGYFRLSGKSPEDFKRMQDEYREAHARLHRRPRVGYRVVRPIPGSETVEASLSWLKPYSGSWMAHHLARHQPPDERCRGTAREALRDIYLRGFEPAQTDPEVKWFLAYCEANVRWVRFTALDFAEWYQHTGQACVLPFRLMEADARKDWHVPEGFTLEEATAEDLRSMFARLERTRPEAYREALDLVPERLDLARLKGQWSEARLERERRVLVARKDGRAIAMGVMESAHAGLNLFHVLNGLRIIPLEDAGSPEAQDAMLALLAGAAAWYRERGLDAFIHYAEEKATGYTERAGLRDLGEGRIWVLSAQLLPDFIEHLCEATTPRTGE
ncbi:PilZ domain-containing protein [Melittangium boletus]|uniref:PilZ domain-containing protein n=1 Tax=Melittangium boletus TaxID=83453 RepID=UPI003DA533F6